MRFDNIQQTKSLHHIESYLILALNKYRSNPGQPNQSPKASRLADMETILLRVHYHASFIDQKIKLLNIQSIGLLDTKNMSKKQK